MTAVRLGPAALGTATGVHMAWGSAGLVAGSGSGSLSSRTARILAISCGRRRDGTSATMSMPMGYCVGYWAALWP